MYCQANIFIFTKTSKKIQNLHVRWKITWC